MADFRILSLDGGGTWALIQVRTLIDLYSKTKDGSDVKGRDVLKRFDLVVANSAGSLVLGGLLENKTLKEILDCFVHFEQREKIFVELSSFAYRAFFTVCRVFPVVRRVLPIVPSYNTEKKLVGLKSILKDVANVKMNELPACIGRNVRGRPVHVVICAFDYDVERGVFFRSDHESLAASNYSRDSIGVVDAIHCSTNAPVAYFAGPAITPDKLRLWDGAIGGYNNPILAGAIEAVANLERYGTDRQSIKVLSLGTGTVILPRAQGTPGEDPDLVIERSRWGILADVIKLATSIIDDPPDAATFHAHLMLGCTLPPRDSLKPGESNIVRLNPLVQPVPGDAKAPWKVPDCMTRSQFNAIKEIDMITTDQSDIDLLEKFCCWWMKDGIPNQPIRANSTTLAPEIGAGRYKAARAAWRKLAPD